MYSKELLARFLEPGRVGDLLSPSAVATQGNPACGDVVQIGIEVTEGSIREARFRTRGCAVAIAASDAVCELATGRSLTAAEMLDAEEVAAALGGVPRERDACVVAPLGALRSALRQLRHGEDPIR
ncbi:MAG: iron-sulfur cluster assembly scaffold protein [Candidatus Methylomirabilales bacterium]